MEIPITLFTACMNEDKIDTYTGADILDNDSRSKAAALIIPTSITIKETKNWPYKDNFMIQNFGNPRERTTKSMLPSQGRKIIFPIPKNVRTKTTK